MKIRFIPTRDSLLLAYVSVCQDSCFNRETTANEVYSNGMRRIAGFYHVMNKSLIESNEVDLKISISDDESLLLYRIAGIRNHYFTFDPYFLGGEHLPINLLISTAIPISDELFRETNLIEEILERERMGHNPVVVGGNHPDAMPMTFFFSKPNC